MGSHGLQPVETPRPLKGPSGPGHSRSRLLCCRPLNPSPNNEVVIPTLRALGTRPAESGMGRRSEGPALIFCFISVKCPYRQPPRQNVTHPTQTVILRTRSEARGGRTCGCFSYTARREMSVLPTIREQSSADVAQGARGNICGHQIAPAECDSSS
jgi:hypothetical protein